MTRFLLDTHVWLWMQASPSRLNDDLLDELSDEANDVLLSAASGWEIAIKYALGKLPLPDVPRHYVPDRMRRSGTTGIPVAFEHVLAVADLPLLHRDPFDRLLVAQARQLELRLVTADALLTQYDVDVHLVAKT